MTAISLMYVKLRMFDIDCEIDIETNLTRRKDTEALFIFEMTCPTAELVGVPLSVFEKVSSFGEIIWLKISVSLKKSEWVKVRDGVKGFVWSNFNDEVKQLDELYTKLLVNVSDSVNEWRY